MLSLPGPLCADPIVSAELFPGHSLLLSFEEYPKTSNISGTLVGNKIVDHSDVVAASPAGAAPTTSSLDLILGWDKDKCKTGRETFKFGGSVQLKLEV